MSQQDQTSDALAVGFVRLIAKISRDPEDKRQRDAATLLVYMSLGAATSKSGRKLVERLVPTLTAEDWQYLSDQVIDHDTANP